METLLRTDLAWATDGLAGFMLVRQSGVTEPITSVEIAGFLQVYEDMNGVKPDPSCRECYGLGYRFTLSRDHGLGSRVPGARRCPCTRKDRDGHPADPTAEWETVR